MKWKDKNKWVKHFYEDAEINSRIMSLKNVSKNLFLNKVAKGEKPQAIF